VSQLVLTATTSVVPVALAWAKSCSLDVWLSSVGLALGLAAAIVLLINLFITDDEIERLSKLPIGESGTNLTLKGDSQSRPVAIVITEDAHDYARSFVKARTKERFRGRWALGLLIGGFALQFVAIVLGAVLPN